MSIPSGQRCEWCGNVEGLESCACGPPEIEMARRDVAELRLRLDEAIRSGQACSDAAKINGAVADEQMARADALQAKLDEMTKRCARAEAAVRFHSVCYPKALSNPMTGASVPIHDPDSSCRMMQMSNDIAEVIHQREDFSDRLDAANRELAKLRERKP